MADILWTITHDKILEYILLLVCLRYLLVDICGIVQYRAHGRGRRLLQRHGGLVLFPLVHSNQTSQVKSRLSALQDTPTVIFWCPPGVDTSYLTAT